MKLIENLLMRVFVFNLYTLKMIFGPIQLR